MAKQLFTTLTDSAVRDASYISDAVDCDGFYSVYDTMVENIDEYIDAIFKSNKDSLLHRYIRYNLVSGLLYEEVIDNCPEEYVLNEHNEALFHLFGYSFADVGELPPEYPDFNDEYLDEWEEFAKKVNEFYCENINDKWADHVFYVLFSNKDFLFRFNTEVARVVQEFKITDYPNDMKKDGVIKRKSFPQWLQKAVKMRDRNRCQLCGTDLSGTYNLSTENFDHMIPLEDGGTNDPCNIQLTCEHCNKSKGARSRDYKNIMIPFW